MGISKENKHWLKAINKPLIYILFLILAYLIYKPAFSSYFFQDDWFTLKISQISSIGQFFSFLVPRTDVIYFRPVGMQIYFFIMKSIFGINPFYFRLSTLALYALNGLLVYVIFNRLKIPKLISFVSASLYVSSVVTYIPFFWSATLPFVLGPTFFLLSFLTYIEKPANSLNKITSLIFYILGLLTLEIVVILPVVLLVWEVLYNNRKNLKSFIRYLIPVLPYIYLRLIAFPVPLTETYALHVSLLSTLRTYLFWIFNWPEEIGRQMTGPLTINLTFIKDFSGYVNIWSISTLTLLVMIIVVSLLNKGITYLFRKEKYTLDKTSLFGVIWFILALFPLLLFSTHTFPYYLPVPLVGFLIIISAEINYIFNKIIRNIPIRILYLSIIFVLWFYSSFTTVKFNQVAHWAPRRAKLSEEAVKKVESMKYRQFSSVYVRSEEYKLPLNDQDAFQVLFGSQVKTIYGESIQENSNPSDSQGSISI